MQITERPYNISHSLNDIRYVFQLANLDRPGLRLQVKLRAKTLGGAYSDVYTFLLQPGTDGMIYLYVQEYINSLLTYVLPAFDAYTRFTNADEQACIFTIHYREIVEGVQVPDYTITEETDYTLYAIKGGIEKHLFSRNNFFKYFEANKPFLTWQPVERIIDKEEIVFLTFLNPNYNSADLTQAYAFCYQATDVDNYIQGGLVNFTSTGLLTHICINVAQNIGVLDINRLYKLEVGVVPSNSASLYNYTYYFEHRPVYKYYDLICHNSLGGIDPVRVHGEVAESFDRATADGAAGKNIQDVFADFKGAEAMYSGIALQRKYKGDVGYLVQKHMQYALMELLASPGIYMRNPFRWVPVVALQKSQDLGSKRSSRNSFPIEWALSETNEVYTPSIGIGKGNTEMAPPPTDDGGGNVCANVTNLTVSYSVSNDLLHSYAHYSFQPVPGVHSYTALLIDENNAVVSTQTFPVTDTSALYEDGVFTDLVPDAGSSINIVTNCSSDSHSNGVSAAIIITPIVCPAVGTYSFILDGTSLDLSIALPTSPYSGVGINGVHYELWKADADNGDEIIDGGVFDENNTSMQWTDLDSGTYYAILKTNCEIGESTPVQTNQLILDNTIKYDLVVSSSAGLVLVYCQQNGSPVQAPFNTLLTVQVQWTDASNNSHTDFVNATLTAGTDYIVVATHNNPGESINNYILMNANPSTDGTSSYNLI